MFKYNMDKYLAMRNIVIDEEKAKEMEIKFKPKAEYKPLDESFIKYMQEFTAFHEAVIKRLPMDRVTDKTDIESIFDCIKDCFMREFSVDDAIRYTRLTEHVSPSLSEEYACAEMKKISDKYK